MPSYDGLLHHFVRKWQLVGELLKLEAAVKILDIKTSGVDVSRRQPLLNLRNRLMDSHTSKAAYELLHSRFPRNPWTAKTPYWY